MMPTNHERIINKILSFYIYSLHYSFSYLLRCRFPDSTGYNSRHSAHTVQSAHRENRVTSTDWAETDKNYKHEIKICVGLCKHWKVIELVMVWQTIKSWETVIYLQKVSYDLKGLCTFVWIHLCSFIKYSVRKGWNTLKLFSSSSIKQSFTSCH